MLYGILAGVGIFLIHNLIEFSMFEPGPLCLFGILVGSALGIRLGNPPVRSPQISPLAIAGLAMACAVWLAAGYGIAGPLLRRGNAAHRGDDQLRAGDYEAASGEYVNAALILPINADYAFRAARALHLSIGPAAPLTDPRADRPRRPSCGTGF